MKLTIVLLILLVFVAILRFVPNLLPTQGLNVSYAVAGLALLLLIIRFALPKLFRK